jgi:hypothetical protein
LATPEVGGHFDIERARRYSVSKAEKGYPALELAAMSRTGTRR